MSEAGAQWWVVYVRWINTGKRETIRTTRPADVSRLDVWVLACLPIGRLWIAHGVRWWSMSG